MTDIIKLYPKNAAENPDNVLEQAIDIYDCVLIMGWDKEGKLDCRASLNMDREALIFILELFKFKLLNGDYDENT